MEDGGGSGKEVEVEGSSRGFLGNCEGGGWIEKSALKTRTD
jgi:hypothetical protein